MCECLCKGEGCTALYSGCMEALLLQSPAMLSCVAACPALSMPARLEPGSCTGSGEQLQLWSCGVGVFVWSLPLTHAYACLLGPLLLGWSHSRLSSGTMRCSASSSCACDTPLCMSAVLPVLSLLLLEAAFVCCLVGSLFQQKLWGADGRAALRFRVRPSSSAMQLSWPARVKAHKVNRE